MKRIPTSATLLIRHFPIRPHNTITNRTLRLPLQRALNVAPPRTQRIDQAAVENGDRAEASAQPGLPFLLIDGDAVEALDVGVCEGEGGGERDAHGHCLLVEDVGGCYFASARGDAHIESVVSCCACPCCYAAEGCGDDGRGDVFFGPWLEGHGDGTRFAGQGVEPALREGGGVE